MATNDNIIGPRLRSERQRLKLSQTALARNIGVSRATQINYESGRRVPDVGYLLTFGKLGGDVGYIATGERTTLANSYSSGVARVLPYVTRRAGLNSDALHGIFDLVADDERTGFAAGQITGDVQKEIPNLVNALFEHGDLLGKIFVEVAKALHDADARLAPLKKAHIVMMLYIAFKKRGNVEKRTLDMMVKAAI